MNQAPISTTPSSATAATDTAAASLSWTEKGTECHALWRSERNAAPPKRVVIADDTLNADSAYRLACEGTGMVWRGDFQNARLLLQAMMRRANAPIKPGKARAKSRAQENTPITPQQAFHLHRQAQSQRARTLSMLLIPLNADRTIPLRRAPDLRQACLEAWGPIEGKTNTVTSLRELLGVVGAHEWRKKGVMVAALNGHLPAVQLLADAGAQLARPGWTALHYAAFGGHVEVCRYLLGRDADIDARSPNGTTPLMMAALQGHLEAARLLVWEVADVSLRNEAGLTALGLAERGKFVDIVALLRKAGAR